LVVLAQRVETLQLGQRLEQAEKLLVAVEKTPLEHHPENLRLD
jgi:hypothetical protein